jgi:hypothetical protein
MAQAQATKTVPVVAAPVAAAPAPVDPMANLDLTALMNEFKTKSSVIRHLSGQGFSRSQIATFMNIRYQHVRNVLTQPLKAPAPTTEPTPETE